MCHYTKLTFPVPAVIVVILYGALVVVEPVSPAPIVIVFESEYLKITTPEPPFPLLPETLLQAPEPLPVLAVAFELNVPLKPFVAPPVPAVPVFGSNLATPPPPPARVTDEPVIDEATPLPPFFPEPAAPAPPPPPELKLPNEVAPA
jgi:hypothetical protein